MLFAPYHAVVRMTLRRAFADLSAGNTETAARSFRSDATLHFYGDHALGGEQRGREAIAAWFVRLHRVFPGLKLRPLDIIVNGGPWDTKIATRFSVDATLPGGEAYHNEGMQYVRLRFAAIVDDRLYEDTARLSAALATIASAGNAEAAAAPLGA